METVFLLNYLIVSIGSTSTIPTNIVLGYSITHKNTSAEKMFLELYYDTFYTT